MSEKHPVEKIAESVGGTITAAMVGDSIGLVVSTPASQRSIRNEIQLWTDSKKAYVRSDAAPERLAFMVRLVSDKNQQH